MGFVRRGGGGGGGGDEGGGDEEQGVSIKRCEICRRELLPWQDACPDDGGRAITPQEVEPEHDALLARLLAEEDDGEGDGEAAAASVEDGDEDVEHEPDATDDEPTWPGGEDPSIG